LNGAGALTLRLVLEWSRTDLGNLSEKGEPDCEK
jgi:hypothetical protein